MKLSCIESVPWSIKASTACSDQPRQSRISGRKRFPTLPAAWSLEPEMPGIVRDLLHAKQMLYYWTMAQAFRTNVCIKINKNNGFFRSFFFLQSLVSNSTVSAIKSNLKICFQRSIWAIKLLFANKQLQVLAKRNYISIIPPGANSDI